MDNKTLKKHLMRYLEIGAEIEEFCRSKGIQPVDANLALGIAYCIQNLCVAGKNKQEPEIFLTKNLSMIKELSISLFDNLELGKEKF